MSKDLAKNDAGDINLNAFKGFIEGFGDKQPRKSCKLCNSKFRKEAEDMAERGTSNRQIYRFLVEDKKEEISYGAVNSHLNNHFREEHESLNLQEFASKLAKWGTLAKNDEALFGRYINFLDMEAMSLAAENSNLPLDQRRRNDELILKIAQIIASYKEQLHRIHAEMRPVEVVITSLNRIIQVKLEGCKDPEVKNVLTDIIEQLVREVGDLPVEEKAEN